MIRGNCDLSTKMNPYRLAFVRMARRERTVGSTLARLALAVLAGSAASYLLRDSIFAWRATSDGVYFPAAVAALGRIGVVVAGVATFAAYDLFVRDPLRGVVDLHPVLAREWVGAQSGRLLHNLVPTVLSALPFLAWFARDTRLLVGSAALLVGAGLAGGFVGAGVSLAAPAIGANPALAGALDAIRGPNPREQAALIWAPATALALAGASVVAASFGLGAVLAGNPLGAVLLALPFLSAGAGFFASHRDARTLAAIPAILGEVQAAHSAANAPEDSRRVYAEGIAERFPNPLQRELVRVLRHGWRGHRGTLSLAWVGAFIAAAAGFSADYEARGRLVVVAGAIVAIVAFVGPRLRAEDPPWLDVSMPGRPLHLAHFFALWLWTQPTILGGIASLALRQGYHAIRPFAALELLAVTVAFLASRLPAPGYVPAAMLAWALVVA